MVVNVRMRDPEGLRAVNNSLTLDWGVIILPFLKEVLFPKFLTCQTDEGIDPT